MATEASLATAENPGARRRGPRGIHPYWALVVVAALTIAALIGYRHLSEERDLSRFRNAVESVQDNLHNRIDAYISILLATRSRFISARSDVDVTAFRRFVEDLEIERRYPGLQGVGFTRRMRPDEVAAVTAEVERQTRQPFHVWPDEPRDEYHAILFLEPMDRRNRAAIGYDMFTDPVRHEAMARARDTGQPAASGRVTLVQEIDRNKQSGFLIYVPVYREDLRPTTVARRREELLGFVYSPFRVDDLMTGIFGSQREPRVAFDLYDGEETTPATLMHEGIPRTAQHASHATKMRFEVAGRPWTIDIRTTPAFESSSSKRFFPHLVLIALLINAGFGYAVHGQLRARKQEGIARQRLAILADLSKRFSAAQLDLDLVLATICYEVSHQLAESCAISLLDEAGTHLELARNCHIDPEAERSIREVLAQARVPVGQTSVGRVAASGEAILVQRVDMRALLESTRTEAYREHLRRHPIATLVIVPLRVGERVIGTITASRGPGQPSFTQDDQRLLQDVADRAAFAIENARLAQRLKQSVQDAQEAVRLRDEFLSIAGHELNTPVAALQLQVEGLLRQSERGALGEVHPRLLERLGKAQAHVERLEVLIAALLDVSKIAAGKLALQREDVELSALLADIIDRFNEPLMRAGCDVSLRASERVVGHWDRVRLDQVFTNLLNNALKYGAGKPIDISIGADGGQARVAVRDHGIGVSADDRQRIFGRFERAVSERNYGGLGLGLWISHEIVEALGGTIHVDSEVGTGSTFTVELPLEQKAA